MKTKCYLAMLCCALASSCTAFFFSGIYFPDRTRPVALIELRGEEAKLGATTSEGILFLNDTSAVGPCRVHYFLGPDLVVDDGEVRGFSSTYSEAEIDLKTQAVPVLTRDPRPDDELVALVLVGNDVERVTVELANDGIATGYALKWPGRALPAGTGIFQIDAGRNAGELRFVGLASDLVEHRSATGVTQYITFTGPARMREALATPRPMFTVRPVKHRPDGITIRR